MKLIRLAFIRDALARAIRRVLSMYALQNVVEDFDELVDDIVDACYQEITI